MICKSNEFVIEENKEIKYSKKGIKEYVKHHSLIRENPKHYQKPKSPKQISQLEGTEYWTG